MYEVELKVPADHGRVAERLDHIGATHVDTVRQADTYYDAPDRNFAETDEALRIRRETRPDSPEEAVLVTYKGPLVDSESKTREEAETAVEDGDALADLLDGLGYEPAAAVEKRRKQYAVEDCTVTLDAVDGLGQFVEVEHATALDDDSESSPTLDELRGEAIEVLERLGLDAEDQIRTSYLGLLLAADDE